MYLYATYDADLNVITVDTDVYDEGFSDNWTDSADTEFRFSSFSGEINAEGFSFGIEAIQNNAVIASSTMPRPNQLIRSFKSSYSHIFQFQGAEETPTKVRFYCRFGDTVVENVTEFVWPRHPDPVIDGPEFVILGEDS